MTYDRSPLWLQELQIALDRRYLDRLDRAIDELVRLGWTCERYKVPANGHVERISIHLNKMLETNYGSQPE